MPADYILHPPTLGCIDKEEVGQALDVVEEDHQAGEVAGRKSLKAGKILFLQDALDLLFTFNLANMKGKTT